jgi:membrane-associated phospholipid phosphatase
LTSAAYTAAFQEVKSLGASDSTTRTPAQTEIALFWAGAAGTFTAGGYWNQIAQTVAVEKGNSLVQNARLFALLNVTQADAAIAVWDAKYAYNFWRPVTAIRAGDTDGNPDTTADPAWTPLLVTPNHPSYTSAHSGVSGAAAGILAAFFGSDAVPFTIGSDGVPGVTHSFSSFSAAAQEVADSRLYAGIHWRFDNTAGLTLGGKVGAYVFGHYLLPVHRSDDGGGGAALASHQVSPGKNPLVSPLLATEAGAVSIQAPLQTGGLSSSPPSVFASPSTGTSLPQDVPAGLLGTTNSSQLAPALCQAFSKAVASQAPQRGLERHGASRLPEAVGDDLALARCAEEAP